MARALLLISILTASCARDPLVKFAAPPPAAPQHRLEYQEGLRAFQEFTPQGYLRAIEHFHRALDLSPNTCEYALYLAQTNLFLAQEQRSNYEDFSAALQAGAPPSCGAGSAFSLRLEALAADFAPRRDRTPVTKITEASQLDPADPYNWLVSWKLNPTAADNSLFKALEIAPELAISHFELGNYELLTGDYLGARKAFESALQRSPGHFRSVIGLAQAISSVDEDEDVEPLYKKAVELAPTFLEGRVLLGDYYSGIEEIDLAQEQYLQVISHNPRFEAAQLRLGITYLQTGKWDDAERAFQVALAINPSSYEAFYYMGNIWVARGNLAKARESYEQSLSFVLNFPEASYALGTVHFREHRVDLALEQFEKVLRTNKRHADAYFSRAAVWSERSFYAQAIEDYNRALGLYEEQMTDILKSIAQYDERGLAKKAEAERRKKERLEGIMERARQFRMAAEDAWRIASSSK